MSARLLVGIFTDSDPVAESLKQRLVHSALVVSWSASEPEFIDWVTDNRHRIDCLVIQQTSQPSILEALQTRSILLPAIAIQADRNATRFHAYHEAVVYLPPTQFDQLEDKISNAIERFIQIPTEENHPANAPVQQSEDNQIFLLSLQQQRLIEKLQERLGYLGVYYKRSSQNFFRNMTPEERHEFLTQLRQDYRRIILTYFSENQDSGKTSTNRLTTLST
ncbi:MAG: circadian clock protein KaiA [Cyanobacteria bacterium J06626_18]